MKKEIFPLLLILGLIAFVLFTPVVVSEEEEIIIVQLPLNSVIMYHGSIGDFNSDGYMINNTDWHLCNGLNGTPNMLSKFVVGYNEEDNDYDELGEQGGLEVVKLNVNEMPSHEHGYLDLFHVVADRALGNGLNKNAERLISTGSTTDSVGGNVDHENRPPYYVIMYIIKISEVEPPVTVSVTKEVAFKAQSSAKGSSAPTDALRAIGASGDILMPVVQFSKVTQQDVHGEYHLPSDIDDSVNIEFHLMWIPGDSWTSGNYVWKLEYLVKEEYDNMSTGVPTTISMDITPSNAVDMIETEFSATIDADAEQIIFAHFYRDVANDNGDDVGEVVFFEVKYTSNKRGEAT